MAKKIIVIIVLLLVLSGFGYSLYGMYTTAKSINAKVEVASVKLKGFNPPFKPLPDAAVITFRILVNNTSSHTLKVEKIVYNVYVEGVFLGNGYKEGIFIPANSTTPVYLDLEVKDRDALALLAELASKRDTSISYQVKATATIPVEFYGLVKVFSLSIPLEISGVLQVE
ncbi:MAG: LEA type 2 family protein [Desulfurococcus sp.]|nr:LEA type 2 family protein [Desulfurococcus sp.]